MPQLKALSPAYVGRKVNADGLIITAREKDMLAVIVSTGSTEIPEGAARVLAANREAWAVLDESARVGEQDVAIVPIRPIPPREEDIVPRVAKAVEDARSLLPEEVRERIPAGNTMPVDQSLAIGKRARNLKVPLEALAGALVRAAADGATAEDDKDHFVTADDRWLLDAMVADQNGQPLPPRPAAKDEKRGAGAKEPPAKEEPAKPAVGGKKPAKDEPAAKAAE